MKHPRIWTWSLAATGGLLGALAGPGPVHPAAAQPLQTDSPRADCALRAPRPCPISRGEPLAIHGPFVAQSARPNEFRMRFANFSGRGARTLAAVRSRVGRTFSVRLGAATRITIVQPSRRTQRVSRARLQTALRNYSSAPVYLSARLLDGSRLDDRVVQVRAQAVTLDLSGGALADLSATWRVAGNPDWSVRLRRAADTEPPTWFGDITEATGAPIATVSFTQPASGVVCSAVFGASSTRTPGKFDCGPISDSGARLGPIDPIVPGGAPITLLRAR